jgi:arabinogalactan endo-1,4-beta-galactosidase
VNLKRRIIRTTATLTAAAASLAVFASSASAAKIDYGILSQDPPPDTQDYTLMNKGGVDLRRLPLGWDTFQQAPGDCTPEGGACDWSTSDLAIGGAAANGIETLPYFYNSARFVNSNPIKPPLQDLSAWADWIQAAVQRYGRRGVYWQGDYQAQFGAGARQMPVDTWQIWNEETSNQFFLPKPNVKKFVKLLKPASKAISRVDKKAEILLGGVFGETGPKGMPLRQFFKQLYNRKRVEKLFDAVAVHPYSPSAKGVLRQVRAIRKAADKGGDKKADVWVTELGYASAGPKRGRSGEVVKKGEKGQAKALKGSFKLLKKDANKLELAGIVWYAWEDVDNPGLCKFCQRAGLIDLQGRPKQAYKAFKKFGR